MIKGVVQQELRIMGAADVTLQSKKRNPTMIYASF